MMPHQPSQAPGLPGKPVDAAQVMSVMEEVIALFLRLRAVLEDIHGHSSISGSMRGVMRDLKHNGPQTVPQMARRRPVSRQHIQAIVNDLLREDLVCLSENPRHKRSRMVQLTPTGERELQKIVDREHAVLNEVVVPLSSTELDRTADNLASLRNMLERPEWRDTVLRVLYQDGETPNNPWMDEPDEPRDQVTQPVHDS